MHGKSNMETYITICKTDSQWEFAVWTSLVAQMVKASAYNVGDPGSIPGLGRSPGEGSGTLLQYSCLENPMEGGAWWAPVHSVAKSRTRLSTHTPRTPKQAQKALEKLSTLQVGYKEE